MTRLAAGEDVVTSRYGKPIVRITQLKEPKRRIQVGLLGDKVIVEANFDAPMLDEVMVDFEGR